MEDLKSKLYTKVSNASNHARDLYFGEFLKYLSENAYVVISDTEGIYAKQKVSIDDEEVINRNLKNLGITNSVCTGSTEIKNFYTKVLDSILKEFFTKYNSNSYEQLLISLYSFKEINTIYIFELLLAAHNEDSECKREDLIVLKNTLQYSKSQDLDGYNKLFKALEIYLSKDKLGIDILIEALIDNNENADKFTEYKEEIVDLELLKFVKTLGQLTILKDLAISSQLKDNQIRVDENSIIRYEVSDHIGELSEEFIEKNISWLENKKNNNFHIDDVYKNRINTVLKSEWGYNEIEFDNIYNYITREPVAKYYVLSLDELNKYVSTASSINDENLEKLVDRITRFKMNFDIKLFLDTERVSKISRKCIIPLYNNYFLFSDTLLLESIGFLKKDIYDRKNLTDSLLEKLGGIFQDIDTEFELLVKGKIEQLRSVVVKHTIEKIKNTTIYPPGEIDLLFLDDNEIFIIECKNFPFKSNLIAIRNEVNKVNNKFTTKLRGKVEFIKDNLEIFLKNDFHIDSIDTSQYTIKGVFVTNAFSFASILGKSDYDVINITEVEEYFKKNT